MAAAEEAGVLAVHASYPKSTHVLRKQEHELYLASCVICQGMTVTCAFEPNPAGATIITQHILLPISFALLLLLRMSLCQVLLSGSPL
jgi:hypothetical protein